MEARLNNLDFQIIDDDITALAVDAIVISVPPELKLIGEIGERIFHRGGPAILDELDERQYCEAGEAIVTHAGTLPSQWIIHAACPRMGTGGERGKLASVIWNAMHFARSKQMQTVAFSAIATGNFGYPVEGCASIMAQKLVDYSFEEPGHLQKIIICLEDSQTKAIFETAFQREIDIARRDAHIS